MIYTYYTWPEPSVHENRIVLLLKAVGFSKGIAVYE